ncbi:MAG: cation-translocating P-type ATPase [Erysipelotrichales bacterium]
MWFNKKLNDVFTETNSSLEGGLNDEQISKNKEKYGENVLEKVENDSALRIVINNIIEPLNIVLIGVILICFFIQEYKEVIIISVIITINIIISTIQELKSQKALDALKQLSSPKSTVIRNGETIEIDSDQLVVGDIVILEAGNYIPADLRVIEAGGLSIDESALTGESIPVEKEVIEIEDEDTLLADRLNMLYSSTFITNGRAKGIVVSVGLDTEVGKIAGLISSAPKTTTPLQDRLAELSKYISVLAFVVAAIIFALNFFVNKEDIASVFIGAITLAVAIIPESLPVIVSIILAISVSKMAKHHTIIKKLPAVESLGAVNVICTDKTGTLTLNKMSVTDTFCGIDDVNKVVLDKDSRLVQAMALCNDSFVNSENNPVGDPTELALTYYVQDKGINELEYRKVNERIEEIPFDSSRKLMTTLNKVGNEEIAYTKGAIDQLLAKATMIVDKDEIRAITQEDKDIIMENANSLSKRALRVLAFGYHLSSKESLDEENIIFIGAVGMIDPERQEAKVAIAKAKHAGVKTIMITGDHPVTAYAIAQNLDMVESKEQVITGSQLAQMSDEELFEKANTFCVYSRVSPEQKVRIVEALQKAGNTVSMTGDGVNDAPSLQTAHIGVAMGITGTDVAKQASDMILMDDNFATIVYAVEEGRNIYNKIKRAVQFILATNLGEVSGIFVATLFSLGTPLGAIHVLWVNLIVESLIAIPISMDGNDSSVMNDKPRKKDETIFAGILGSILLLGFIVGGTMLGSYLLIGYLGYDELVASSVAFAVMATAPMIYVLSLRTPNKPLHKSKPLENKVLLGAIGLGIVLNLVIINTPLNTFFNLTALTGTPLLIAIVGILIPTFLYEIYKLIKNSSK